MKPAVDVSHVHVSAGSVEILHDLSLSVAPGTRLGLVGPNGAGKSTLIRSLYRALRPRRGVVMVYDRPLGDWGSKQLAREMAVMPQEQPDTFDYTAGAVVAMGRAPYLSPFGALRDEDTDALDEAMTAAGVLGLADRLYVTLSGGERQRVLLARALAQGAEILVLDEPTNHLDLRAQRELMDAVAGTGKTVIAALHDLSLAAHYCDVLAVLDQGRIVATGAPPDVLTPRLLAEVYGVEAECSVHAVTGSIVVTVTGLHSR